MNTLVLSDLHFGSAASRCANMLDSLRALCRSFDRVILNGDTLERYECLAAIPESESLLRTITEVCASNSGPPELLSGNHDPAISARHWVYLPDSATLIFHGDCISDITHPSSRQDQLLAAKLAEKWATVGGRPTRFLDLVDVHRQVQADYLSQNPLIKEARSPLQYLIHVFTPPQKPLHVLNYWRQAPHRVARLAATFDQPVRNVVFGHTHLSGHWRIDGLNVYNTGSFMPLSTPRVVLIEGAKVLARPLSALLRTNLTVAPPLAKPVSAAARCHNS